MRYISLCQACSMTRPCNVEACLRELGTMYVCTVQAEREKSLRNKGANELSRGDQRKAGSTIEQCAICSPSQKKFSPFTLDILFAFRGLFCSRDRKLNWTEGPSEHSNFNFHRVMDIQCLLSGPSQKFCWSRINSKQGRADREGHTLPRSRKTRLEGHAARESRSRS